jgi:hypothetical protein
MCRGRNCQRRMIHCFTTHLEYLCECPWSCQVAAIQIKRTFYRTQVRCLPQEEIEMSAITVFVPQAHHSVELPRSRPTSAQSCTVINTVPATASPKSSGNRAAADWRLTNRGIAVVMVIAAMILAAAITVIGITAVRVTGPGGDLGLRESRQAQH